MNEERFGLGVVVGKFLPPHRGHRFLVESALARCERVVVIICGKPVDPIPPELRAGWLREMVPAAEIMLIDDRYDESDSRVWAENTVGWLGRSPDAVFTSEGLRGPLCLLHGQQARHGGSRATRRPVQRHGGSE